MNISIIGGASDMGIISKCMLNDFSLILSMHVQHVYHVYNLYTNMLVFLGNDLNKKYNQVTIDLLVIQ